ncbi:MAG: twin transmembrane helix small protein [Pseudomonadota bacterium]
MSRVFFILMIISMVLVLLSLIIGLVAMVKGGEFNKKYGNKLMRMRVTLQGLALGLFVLAVWTGNNGE